MAKKTSKAARQSQKAKSPAKRRPVVSPVVETTEEARSPAPVQSSAVSLEAFRRPSGTRRPSRSAASAPVLAPAEEYGHVRADLTRVLWVGGLMIAILIGLSFVMR